MAGSSQQEAALSAHLQSSINVCIWWLLRQKSPSGPTEPQSPLLSVFDDFLNEHGSLDLGAAVVRPGRDFVRGHGNNRSSLT